MQAFEPSSSPNTPPSISVCCAALKRMSPFHEAAGRETRSKRLQGWEQSSVVEKHLICVALTFSSILPFQKSHAQSQALSRDGNSSSSRADTSAAGLTRTHIHKPICRLIHIIKSNKCNFLEKSRYGAIACNLHFEEMKAEKSGVQSHPGLLETTSNNQNIK